MKLKQLMISLLCLTFLVSPAIKKVAAEDTSLYTYTINMYVDDPCSNANKVDSLYFEFKYNTKNGYGITKTEKKYNNDKDFIKKHFVKGNNYNKTQSFTVTLPGRLTKLHVYLDMDWQRLKFTIKSITCNNKVINDNTDYVTSKYLSSSADVYCSMEPSVVDKSLSSYFKENKDTELTENQAKQLSKLNGKTNYNKQFKDQYDAYIDMSIFDSILDNHDGDINQAYSHSDEISYYKYTFDYYIKDPINLNNADNDEIDCFYIEMHYKNQNGYGDEKTYKLDMTYNSQLKRSTNLDYLSYFQSNNNDGYASHFDVWIPGILTSVNIKINMSGEKLAVDFNQIKLNGLNICSKSEDVSSKYFNSSTTLTCHVPVSLINCKEDDLKNSKDLKDQYGGLVSDKLLNLAVKNPAKYLYHSKS